MCRHEGKYWRCSNATNINCVYQQCSSIGDLVPAPMPPLCSLHIHTNPLGAENHLPLLPFPLLPAPNTYLTSKADDRHGYIWIPEYHTNHIIFSLKTETATDSVVGKVLLCPEYQNTENCYLIELGNTVTSIQRFSDFKEIGECRLIRCRFNHKSGSTLVQVMVLSFRCWAIIWNNIANLLVAPSRSYDVTIMQCVFSATEDTPDLASHEESRFFWIGWTNGLIEVGKGHKEGYQQIASGRVIEGDESQFQAASIYGGDSKWEFRVINGEGKMFDVHDHEVPWNSFPRYRPSW